MSIQFIWQLPTAGDGRYGDAKQRLRGERFALDRPPFTAGVSDPRGARFNYFDYLHQVARAAELAGFDGIKIRHDLEGDEAWIVAGYLARSTRHLKLIAEFDASWGSAVYAAKNAVSFQRYTGGRFGWHILPGNTQAQRRRHADFIEEAELSTRVDEFISVARGVQTTAPFNFKGRYFEVQNGGFQGPLANNPVTVIYLAGEDQAAFRLSARQADVHVLDAAPPEQLAPKIEALRRLAAEQGRALAIGLRIDLLARETEEEALHDARRFWGQSGHPPGLADPVVAPNLWNGFGAGRTGAQASLVGSYGQIIARLVEYANAGIEHFVFAAQPHFEEAYRIGEYVLPDLRASLQVKTLQAA